ncbi:MAG: ribosomal protein S18-alanine N-acetyltransferase [Clostridiales bacterium]|nr:ribosomal protein S18-alanine N-acetyltransferase [Clostridiales bacterium]
MSDALWPSGLSVVPMQPCHLDDLVLLEQQCFSVPWSREGLASELLNPNAVFRVAQLNGKTAGYLGMHHILDECDIANIAVSPDHRRQGIGSRLMFEAVRYGMQSGITQMFLEVRESNAAAISLYQSFDFTAVGRRKNYYSLPCEDAVIMVRRLKGN